MRKSGGFLFSFILFWTIIFGILCMCGCTQTPQQKLETAYSSYILASETLVQAHDAGLIEDQNTWKQIQILDKAVWDALQAYDKALTEGGDGANEYRILQRALTKFMFEYVRLHKEASNAP